jgi:hypothetical protein
MGCFPYAEALVIAALVAACGGHKQAPSLPPSNTATPDPDAFEPEIVEGARTDRQAIDNHAARLQAVEQARAAGILGDARTPPTTLDKAAIRTLVRQRIVWIQLCYEMRLVEQPTLAGTTRVEFTIGLAGKVTRATASGFDPAVDSCVAKEIEQITFPKPAWAALRVTYPFTFRPAS